MNFKEFRTAGNVLYRDPRECTWCNCCFFSSRDMGLHLKAFGNHPHGNPKKNDSLNTVDLDHLGWKPSKFDDSEWCSVSNNKLLKKTIELRGRVEIGGYTYTVSGNGKWFKRRKKK